MLDVLHGEGEPVDAESLRPWAEAARAVAEVEMDHIPIAAPRAEAAHTVAVGTVIYGELLAQLRLVAQEAVSLRRFGPDGQPAEAAARGQPGRAGRHQAGPDRIRGSPAGRARVRRNAASRARIGGEAHRDEAAAGQSPRSRAAARSGLTASSGLTAFWTGGAFWDVVDPPCRCSG